MSKLLRTAEALGIISRSSDLAENNPTNSETPGALIPPSRAHGLADPRGLDAVYRALFIIETAGRQLSLDTWRGSQQIEPPSIVAKPALAMTQRAFIAFNMQSLAQRGNAFWKLNRGADGSVIDIALLNPREVSAALSPSTQRVEYRYRGKAMDPRDLIHLRLTHNLGEALGLGPIQSCMSTLKGALEMRQYADNWIDRSGRPTGIFSTEQQLSAEQAAAYKARANEAFTPGNGVAVLGGGLSYQPLLLNPKEMQFLESQEANTLSVARMFGIPERLMLASVNGSSMTYANLEQDELSFLRYTLMAYLTEIEDAFDQVTARGQTVRFNVDGLLRTDTKTRYEAHTIGINAGFLTISEARQIEGLEPLAAPAPEMKKEQLA